MTEAATPVLQGSPEQETFLAQLVEAGLLIPGGVDGLFGRGQDFERVIERFDAYVTRRTEGDNAQVLRFPPLISRSHYERTDHVRGFPNLLGCVHSFHGGDADHMALLNAVESGGDWSGFFTSTDVVLTPACCYPLYPMSTGTLDDDGLLFDVQGYCFRHEPSRDPARMQLFRQREFVRIGSPAQALAHRDMWAERACAILREVGLPAEIVPANDPFFGRAGRMLVANQLDQELKFEIVVPITSTAKPTACASSNYHQDHFGEPFEIRLPTGATAHTACIGFGLERVALALFKTHGLDLRAWPESVRQALQA